MAIGQRTKLTQKLQAQICTLIKDKGAYPSVAAVACGISETTFYEWLARGRVNKSSSISTTRSPGGNGPGSAVVVTEPGTRGLGDPDGRYADFADAIKKAEGELEVEMVEDAKAKALKSNSPLASIIFLSRRMRERWAEQVTVATAGREAVASMERIKAAWDAPKVVDGEYTELPQEAPKLNEATTSENGHCASPAEASSDLGFHLPPQDMPIDTETDPDADAETERISEPCELDESSQGPTNTVPPESLEGTPVEILKTKSKRARK